jgi:putative transcriptional regulator
MKKENITRYKPDPHKPFRMDWAALDAMTDEEVEAAALADPDAQPATDEQLARAVRRPNVRAIRNSLSLTQEEFARRFGLPLGTIRDWEQGAHHPDRAAQVLLAVIARDPESVERVVLAQQGK